MAGSSHESPYLGKCRYFMVSNAPANHYNPVPGTSIGHNLPSIKGGKGLNGHQESRGIKSMGFASNSHSYPTQVSSDDCRYVKFFPLIETKLVETRLLEYRWMLLELG